MAKLIPCGNPLEEAARRRGPILIWDNGSSPVGEDRSFRHSGWHQVATPLDDLRGRPMQGDTRFVRDASAVVSQFLQGELSEQETSSRLTDLVQHIAV